MPTLFADFHDHQFKMMIRFKGDRENDCRNSETSRKRMRADI